MFEKLGFSSHERRAIYLLLILILGGVFYRLSLNTKFSHGINLVGQTESVSEEYFTQKNTVKISSEKPLNINTANEEQLILLPGIGVVTAKSIIEYRNSIGQFESTDQLDEVPGIGEKKMLRLKGLIVIQDQSDEKPSSKQ
ncbi:helix-hairpin-helix domain-containing protein [bacterium]|nr:helix-hairpin-helix domain-containing protein [bacterium]